MDILVNAVVQRALNTRWQMRNSLLFMGLFLEHVSPSTKHWLHICLFSPVFYENVLWLCSALVVPIYPLQYYKVNINKIMKQSLQFV